MGDERRDLLEMLRQMVLIREAETNISQLYKAGEIPGFVHLSIGQEAVAVGACWHLRDSDVITSTHRGHGHCLAKGMRPLDLLAELLGRETGACAGRGGSMHVADPRLGIFGANGIVGAGLPIATGAALAARLRGTDGVAVAFFGDGAVAQGAFHESVNLAATLRLPVIFLCENNHYAEFAASDYLQPVAVAQRAAGYGLRHVLVDGNDPVAVAKVVGDAINELRAGGPPVIVEADTYRFHGHYEGDPERYRSPEELTRARERDPLSLCCQALSALGVSDDEITGCMEDAKAEIIEDVELARAAPFPEPSTLHQHVVVRDHSDVIETSIGDDDEQFRYMDAVREAVAVEMSDDPSVFIAGIDVGEGGNVFGVLRGLHEQFPGRVIDTPISESAIVGAGVGAAMAGMRPVVEVMYLDFIGVCFDQLLNQAAKLHFMTGGQAKMALTVRTQFGAGRSSGSQHSQSLEALLAHIPGLKVVMPSTPADAYGLLRAAIRDPDPVIVIENRLLYGSKGPRPSRSYEIPIGKAVVRRPGTDITLVTWSRLVHEALAAAEDVAAEGIATEVIDLRTIAPLDWPTVFESLKKTSRLLIAHEAVTDFGVGAEIAARAVDDGFWYLDAPIRRIGAEAVPPPYAPGLEAAWLPNRARIADALIDLAHS